MRSGTAFSVQRVILGCLSAAALAASACSDGRPTSPIASASSETANQASASSPLRPLLVRKTCSALDLCTVVQSVSGPIPVGTEAFYPGPLLIDRTTSSVIITTPTSG